MKRILIALFIIFNPIIAFANNKFKSIIDSSFNNKNLNFNDLNLPDEISFRIPNKLKFIQNSLKDFKFHFSKVNDEFSNYSKLNTSDIIKRSVELLDFKMIQEVELNTSFGSKLLNDHFKVNFDSLLNFESSLIIRRYLNIYLNANIQLLKDTIQSLDDGTEFLLKNISKINNLDSISFKNIDDNRNDLKLFRTYAERIYTSNLFNIAYSLYKTLIDQNERLLDLNSNIINNVSTTIVETNYGKIAIGGIGDDIYEGNFVLIIDLGGNDNYKLTNNIYQAYSTPLRIIIDLKGNDNYQSENYALGSGIFGINYLFDYEGNDTYISNTNSLGCGIFGIGILEDFLGNDLYESNLYSQGMGLYGIGIIRDRDGNDTYLANSISQGIGLSYGLGLILDDNGNDSYISPNDDNIESNYTKAVSLGNNITGVAGIGILVDANGDDIYKGQNNSLSYSNFTGFSALIDKSGNDKYSSINYSISNAVNGSITYLIDFEGNDNYSHNSNIANATNYAAALFFDCDGNDIYQMSNSIYSSYYGLFFDISGTNLHKQIFSISKNELDIYPNLNRIIFFNSTLDTAFKMIDTLTNQQSEIFYDINNITEYQKNLSYFITDTLLFSQIEPKIRTFNNFEKAFISKNYLKNAKNKNIVDAARYFLSIDNLLVRNNAIIGLLQNNNYNLETLLQILNLDIEFNYKIELMLKITELNFKSISNKEFKKEVLKFSDEFKKEFYQLLLNINSNRNISNKIKDLIKSESNTELKKILKNEK
jgi:hypothetical protein